MLSNGKVAPMTDKLTGSEIVKALRSWLEEIRKHRQAYLEKFNEEHYPSMRYEYLLSDTIHEINRLQAENERLNNAIDEQDIEIARLYKEIDRLKEPTSASAIHILAEKAIEALQEETEKQKTEIMRLQHNERVLSENSIIAKYPHHWLLDKGWFLSKEPDGFEKWVAQLSNKAIKGFEKRLKAKAESILEARLIVIKEKDWDKVLTELVGEDK